MDTRSSKGKAPTPPGGSENWPTASMVSKLRSNEPSRGSPEWFEWCEEVNEKMLELIGPHLDPLIDAAMAEDKPSK